jgi:hypothetical protein
MTTKPTFTGVNVVVNDMDTSAAFYRLLGLEIEVVPVVWPPGTDLGTHRSCAGQSSDRVRIRFKSGSR